MSGIQLRGAIVVVTGASSGLGRRFASDFAADGATVIGVARREALLASLGEDLRRQSPGSRTVVCDVSETDRFVGVLRDVEREFGRIDVLINNAGIGEPEDRTVAASAP